MSVDPPVLSLHLADGESTERTAILQLRNVGRTPLRIIGVETFCGCTIIDQLPKQPIPTGSGAALKFKVSLPGSGTKVTRLAIDYAASTTGRIVVPLKLHGRKPDLPFALLRETGVSLLVADRHRPVTRQLSIETAEKAGDPPWIVGLRPQASWLMATLSGKPKTIASDAGQIMRRYYIDLTATLPAEASDTESAEIEFETDPAVTKSLPKLRVVAKLIPVLKAVPSQLVVSRKAADSGVIERKFAIIAAGAGPWDISADGVFSPGIAIEKLNTNSTEEQTVVVFRAAITPSKLLPAGEPHRVHVSSPNEPVHALDIPVVLLD